MFGRVWFVCAAIVLGAVTGIGSRVAAQAAPPASAQNSHQATQAQPQTPLTPSAPTRADILRGAYGQYRANNDLLFYHLDVRVDPEKKFISGKNTIRFKMLKDDTRIQLDLQQPLNVDKILFGTTELKYEREFGAVFVDFPETLHAGQDLLDRFLLLRESSRNRPIRRHRVSQRSRWASLD